jgi:hypothetical protein
MICLDSDSFGQGMISCVYRIPILRVLFLYDVFAPLLCPRFTCHPESSDSTFTISDFKGNSRSVHFFVAKQQRRFYSQYSYYHHQDHEQHAEVEELPASCASELDARKELPAPCASECEVSWTVTE